MRQRFIATTTQLLDEDPRLALVLAEISASLFEPVRRRHPDRIVNVGIREQLMVSVASGLALTGFRPIVHTIASFAVERPYEQLKVDLGHQDVGAVIVAHGASYDYSTSGRTHQSPEDVALIDTLPGWDIHVPGHPDEVDHALRSVAAGDGRAYLRLSVQENADAHHDGVVRSGSRATVIAVGPMLDRVLLATGDLDVTVLYLSTVRPFPSALLCAALRRPDVVLVEPYTEGTSSAVVSAALADVPHRLLAIGVRKIEHRAYGTVDDHDAAHGLDVASLRHRIEAFLTTGPR
ncbi:MAG TPA: transketolase [Candidatus Limnocylindria bacterium]|nr:transketolase [Candidatus Limnocylindria bacterium]